MFPSHDHGVQKLLIAGGKMQQQESLKQSTAQHNQQMGAVNAIQKEKDLQIKAAKVAAESNKTNIDALLENKKLEIEREKIKHDGQSGSE
jgi:1,4-dihydroxy-2-naphthoyl-CoA synthase